VEKTVKTKHEVFLDITGEVCPLTFVRTKLLIEGMKRGEIVEIRLKGREPLDNVPRSLRQQGHEILSLTPENPRASCESIHRLRVRKG
jgi:TusA-related sulfurtransferase